MLTGIVSIYPVIPTFASMRQQELVVERVGS